MGELRELFLKRNPKKFDLNFDKPYAPFKEWLGKAYFRLDESFDGLIEGVYLLYQENEGEDVLEVVFDCNRWEYETMDLVKNGIDLELTEWQKKLIGNFIREKMVEFEERKR